MTHLRGNRHTEASLAHWREHFGGYAAEGPVALVAQRRGWIRDDGLVVEETGADLATAQIRCVALSVEVTPGPYVVRTERTTDVPSTAVLRTTQLLQWADRTWPQVAPGRDPAESPRPGDVLDLDIGIGLPTKYTVLDVQVTFSVMDIPEPSVVSLDRWRYWTAGHRCRRAGEPQEPGDLE